MENVEEKLTIEEYADKLESLLLKIWEAGYEVKIPIYKYPSETVKSATIDEDEHWDGTPYKVIMLMP